jgi:hypothetical protein
MQAHQSRDKDEGLSVQIDGYRTPASSIRRSSSRLETPTTENTRLGCGKPSHLVTGNLGRPSGLGGLFCLARLRSLVEITLLPAASYVTPAIKDLYAPEFATQDAETYQRRLAACRNICRESLRCPRATSRPIELSVAVMSFEREVFDRRWAGGVLVSIQMSILPQMTSSIPRSHESIKDVSPRTNPVSMGIAA